MLHGAAPGADSRRSRCRAAIITGACPRKYSVRALLDNGHFVGSVGNVGVMALPVWHEEAVLDPELLPLSYAVSILFAYSSYISEERMSQ